MPIPMLADFALRLACGCAALLLLTPWRVVPPAFFRTHCLVMLGLLVLAGLDASRAGVGGPILVAVVTAGNGVYAVSVANGRSAQLAWTPSAPRAQIDSVGVVYTYGSIAQLIPMSRVETAMR